MIGKTNAGVNTSGIVLEPIIGSFTRKSANTLTSPTYCFTYEVSDDPLNIISNVCSTKGKITDYIQLNTSRVTFDATVLQPWANALKNGTYRMCVGVIYNGNIPTPTGPVFFDISIEDSTIISTSGVTNTSLVSNEIWAIIPKPSSTVPSTCDGFIPLVCIKLQ